MALVCTSSILKNSLFSLSETKFFATVSPSPSIELNGGYISVSFFTLKVVASLSYRFTFKNLIPRAVASKQR